MVRRLRRWLATALGLAVIAGFAVINLSGHDPQRWHVDPAELTLRGTPNEYLAAVPGATAAIPHQLWAPRPTTTSPRALLDCFDAIARSQARITVVAGDLDSLMITYVQRSRIVGFPDYITVKAIAHETDLSMGAVSLIVYSRSRYGQGDFGINEARVTSWLAKTGPIC